MLVSGPGMKVFHQSRESLPVLYIYQLMGLGSGQSPSPPSSQCIALHAYIHAEKTILNQC